MGNRDGTKTTTQTELATGSGNDAHEAAEPLPTVLGDRYQIEGLLGAGGMGVVYAARDIHLGRRVAIKLVGPKFESAGREGRLEREAQAMARLRHPNIATVYDIGLSADRLFVVMELVDGGTLADWLGAERRSWRQIVAVLLQAARGLAAAHATGLVHRDFKLDNVLVDNDGVARVSDFGVARLLVDSDPTASTEDDLDAQTVSRTGGVVGTPGYIAPEIVRRESVDARADQFSFCVAAYTALEGQRPFATLDGPNRLAETLGTLRPPRSGTSPRWLQRIIVRGLASDPRARWLTLDDLTAAIEERLGRRRSVLVVAGLGAAGLTILAVMLMTRPAPPLPPDWSPVVLKRVTKDSRLGGLIVSPDGSTLVSFSDFEADVEPRTGPGPVRHVAFPPGLVMASLVKPSLTGDRLFGPFYVTPKQLEIWSFDVATNVPRRLIPPVGHPTLEPDADFDVGPDGSIVFVAAGGEALWRLDPNGATERLLTSAPGERLQWPVLSPDGARLVFEVWSAQGGSPRTEVMNVRSRALAAKSISGCGGFGAVWLTNESLACTPWSFRNVVVIEKTLSSDGKVLSERVRNVGPEYQRARGTWSSAAGVLFATAPSDQHLAFFDLDASAKLRRIALDSITDLPPVGWTSSGSLIFGANIQGHLRIMAATPDGKVETVHAGPVAEVPLAVLGESIIFGRFPGGESRFPFLGMPGTGGSDGELFRLTLPGGAPERLGTTSAFERVICAGGRAKPCLLAERSKDEVLAIEWDPETGRRGGLRARWPITWSGSELSFDGKTVAQIKTPRGNSWLSFLDLETGTRREAGAQMEHPRWQPDGTLLAMAAGAEIGAGLVRLGEADKIDMLSAWVDFVPARARRQDRGDPHDG